MEEPVELKDALLEEIAYHLAAIDDMGDGSKEQQAMVQDLKMLVDSLNAINQTELNALNESERREIERIKNENLYKLEQEKAKLSWQRTTFEMAKIIVPSIISIAAYDWFQRRIIDFEENGRLTTTASRELHLPKFMK